VIIHTKYPANLIETTDTVQQIQQLKLQSLKFTFQVSIQLHIENIHNNKSNFAQLSVYSWKVWKRCLLVSLKM